MYHHSRDGPCTHSSWGYQTITVSDFLEEMPFEKSIESGSFIITEQDSLPAFDNYMIQLCRRSIFQQASTHISNLRWEDSLTKLPVFL